MSPFSHNTSFRAAAMCGLIALGACASSSLAPQPAQDSRLIPFDRYLWQSARQTISFLPLESSDPIGGILETAWGSLRGGTGDRYKLRVEIDYTHIYSRALAVTVRHQVMTDDGYHEVDLDGIAAVQLAQLIGEEAGQLRLAENPGN